MLSHILHYDFTGVSLGTQFEIGEKVKGHLFYKYENKESASTSFFLNVCTCTIMCVSGSSSNLDALNTREVQ